MPKTLPLCLLPLMLLALAGTVVGDEPAAPPRLEVPVGLPVQVDGAISSAEWEGAAERPLGPDGDRLLFAQRDGTLLIGMKSRRPWPEGASLWLGFQREAPEHPGLFEKGAVHVDFEPREHNRPHLLATRHGDQGPAQIGGRIVARAQVDRGESAVELAIDLAELGIENEKSGALRFVALWHLGPRLGRAVWPNTVSLRGKAGTPPEGLKSSATWAALSGWKGIPGPGAYPSTQWAAWKADDDELTRRGAVAHAMAMRIIQDRTYAKMDDAILEKVAGNLQWIAAREPLTPYDILILAQVHRFLNRSDAALALLASLDTHAAWRDSARVLYERAVTEEAAGRFLEAAATWRRAAARSDPNLRSRYDARAAKAEERQDAWTKEQAARAQARARKDLPVVLLRTTRGDIVIQLFRDEIPKGVDHFLGLVQRDVDGTPFYDGTTFHRAEGGYLVQGGDPASRDRDGTGETEDGSNPSGPATVEVEKNERHGFWRGAVGFARSLALVNGSQFFILTTANPGLGDDDYTCFGHVISGMDVVDRIESGDLLLEVRILDAGSPQDTKDEEQR